MRYRFDNFLKVVKSEMPAKVFTVSIILINVGFHAKK
jgi:hypothetical protein